MNQILTQSKNNMINPNVYKGFNLNSYFRKENENAKDVKTLRPSSPFGLLKS